MPEPSVDDVRVYMSLERLGELVAATAVKFALMRDIELPDLSGAEGRELAAAGWQHVVHMADRANFEASVKSDLAQLDTSQGTLF